jgi:hypothetical protein
MATNHHTVTPSHLYRTDDSLELQSARRISTTQQHTHTATAHNKLRWSEEASRERWWLEEKKEEKQDEEAKENMKNTSGCALMGLGSPPLPCCCCVCCYSPPLLLLSPWPPLLALNRRICLRLLMYLFRGLLLLIDARLYVVCYWLAGWLLTHHGAF